MFFNRQIVGIATEIRANFSRDFRRQLFSSFAKTFGALGVVFFFFFLMFKNMFSCVLQVFANFFRLRGFFCHFCKKCKNPGNTAPSQTLSVSVDAGGRRRVPQSTSRRFSFLVYFLYSLLMILLLLLLGTETVCTLVTNV